MQDLIDQWKSQKTADIFYNHDFLKNKNLGTFFSDPLEFGTAGIRGKMGFGSGRVNEFTIGAAAKAYGQFLIDNKKENLKNGVIIAHDNRHNSFFFAQVTFLVLKQMGINAYLFEKNDLQPTPLVSYTIRKLKLAGACIITASHNPKEYNGFKVYNHLGSQLLPEDTKIIQKNMQNINPLDVSRFKGTFDYIDNRINYLFHQCLL